MLKRALFLILFVITLTKSDDNSTTPIVMWHGMGDTCCFPFSLGAIKKLIQEHIDGVYVKSLKIGGCIVEDYKSGFFTDPNKQVADVCNQIQKDELLANGYHGIGFSQGAQFLRALAQRCPKPPMKSLISIGGQHQGVFGLPLCPSLSKRSCELTRKILNSAAYAEWVQKELVQATYWHDPLNEERYINGSIFLADINNERTINADYIQNLRKLRRFVMVKFANDTIVQPKDTEWFAFYKPGQDKEIVPLQKSEIYLKNKLGLRQMDLEGKLVFLECIGDHLQMTAQWFVKNIIPFLKE